MSDNNHLPSAPKKKPPVINKTNPFYLRKQPISEPPAAKQIWVDRLLFLLDTRIDNKKLADQEFMKDIKDQYGELKGATIGDIMHLSMAVRAMQGDTKAYVAIQKVLNDAEFEPVKKEAEDPMVLLGRMLEGAMTAAGIQESTDGPIIIEAEYTEGE